MIVGASQVFCFGIEDGLNIKKKDGVFWTIDLGSLELHIMVLQCFTATK